NGCATQLGSSDTISRGGPIINSAQVQPANTAASVTAGAVNTLAVRPGFPNTILAATVNGGIWKTENGGTNWRATTDKMPSLSIGSIAFSPLEDDVVFAGTGNFSSGRTGGPAAGIYVSTDVGETWTQMAAATL